MSRLAKAAGAWVLSLALFVPAASAADLALVIGNHDYSRAPDARSARADARAVAEALEQGGYEVISATDLNRGEMRRRLADFAGRVGGAERVVVFYSGHALRTGGQSYLAPVDQGNGSLVEVMMDGVPLDLVLRLAGEASGSAVVFVDGAQLDGFTPRAFAEPGLAHIQPPSGVLVISAAAPGRAIPRRSTAMSQFGRQVVNEFLSPGASVGQGVRRISSPAWVTGDTDSSLVLVPQGRGPAAGGTGGGTGGLSPIRAEDQLNLTRSERQRIQQDLTLLGYDTRGVDGIFGSGSRAAIRNWQQANGLQATGYLTAEQVAAIDRQATQGGTPPASSGPAEMEAALGLNAAVRSEIQEELTRLGYDTRGTGGVFGSGTRTAIRNWQRANGLEETGYLTADQLAMIERQATQGSAPPAGASPAEVEASLSLSAAERSEVQESLTRLGYDTRGTDGIFGFGTRTAIRNWQRANGLEETGYLTAEQVAMIDRQAGQQAGSPSQGRPPADPAAAEAALGMTRNDRLSVEQRLAYLGFPPGPQDGFFDNDTRWAIEGYQRSRGYPATGYLDQRTVAGLVEETRGVRTGIVTGAEVLIDILRGLGGQQ